MAVLTFCAPRHSGRPNRSRNAIGRATRKAHCSGRRTASVLGHTSHPIRFKTSNPATVATSGHCPWMASHSATASIAALANVFPSTIVASNC